MTDDNDKQDPVGSSTIDDLLIRRKTLLAEIADKQLEAKAIDAELRRRLGEFYPVPEKKDKEPNSVNPWPVNPWPRPYPRPAPSPWNEPPYPSPKRIEPGHDPWYPIYPGKRWPGPPRLTDSEPLSGGQECLMEGGCISEDKCVMPRVMSPYNAGL